MLGIHFHLLTLTVSLPKIPDKGFTAITQDFASSLSNPALLTQYDSTDDIFFSFNLGGMGSDKFDVIDRAETIANNLKILANDINQQRIYQLMIYKYK